MTPPSPENRDSNPDGHPLADITTSIMDKLPDSNGQSQTRPSDNACDRAPLHERLPPEIFCAIFHLSVSSESPVRDLVTLQLVCRSWCNIITDTSSLWGTINAAEGLPAVRKALRMAKDSLLDLIFIEKSSKIAQHEFFTLARERINQWRSLVVESGLWESALEDLRTQRPPKLGRLHAATDFYSALLKDEIVLFGGEPAPGLKDIRLAHVRINRASLQLSGLKSLHLQGIPSLSAMEITMLINESPALEILYLALLEGTVPLAQAQAGFPSNPPLRLTSLTNLSLYYVPPPFIKFLLSTLVIPRLRSFHVGCRFPESPASQLDTVEMNSVGPVLKSITSNTQTYKVTLSSRGHYVVSTGGFEITIRGPRLSMDHFQEILIWLSGHLERVLPDLPLHLHLENSSREFSYLEWFTRHTNVTILTLYNNPFFGPTLDHDISILGRPTSSPSPIWLLPQLEVLHTNFVWTDGNLDIVDMIEGRHSASLESSATGVDGALPKPFREIWLTYDGKDNPAPNAGFLSKVVRVAGGADVYWEGKKWTVI